MADQGSRRTTDDFELRWTLARKIGGLSALLVLLLVIDAIYNYRALGNTQANQARSGRRVCKRLCCQSADLLRRRLRTEPRQRRLGRRRLSRRRGHGTVVWPL